jgi:hypothetical protein
VLWVCQPLPPARLARIPRPIAGVSPPARVDIDVDDALRQPLHEFLEGRRRALTRMLRARVAAADIPTYMHTRLRVDLELVDDFFELAPVRVRAFRVRHGLPAGAIPADVYAACLLAELRSLLDDATLVVGQGRVGSPNIRSIA